MRSIAIGVSFITAILAATACGGSSASDGQTPAPEPSATDTPPAVPPAKPPAPPVDNGAPSTNFPAPHPEVPQLVSLGGKVLATPKVHIITYPGYDHTAAVTSLAQMIGASTYWSTIVSEYGIGAIAFDGATELTESPPSTISDTAVQTFLADKIGAGTFGAPDANTIYAIFYPKTTTISLGQGGGPLGGGQSCQSFGGYHGNTQVGSGAGAKDIAFAVLPTCSAFAGQSEIDGLTGALSHELAEAVTDPFPNTKPAYGQVDQDHFIWNIFGGSENGDMCAQNVGAFYKPAGFDYVVQRTWSNKFAKAGHDPCAPNLPGVSYFNSGPRMDETVDLDLSLFGQPTITTQGMKIPVGKSRTIEVDLFSDGPTSGPWTVKAIDMLAQYTQSAPTLDFKWDRTSGLNGEKLHLTVTVKSEAGLVKGAHPFLLESKLGTQINTWPALVTDQ